jgi:hypothetical protein
MRKTQGVPHSRSFSRRIKRVLVFMGEVGLFVLGTVISCLIGLVVDSHENEFCELLIFGGPIRLLEWHCLKASEPRM